MRNDELPALTGIRFYAAAVVFLSHVPVIPGMEKLSDGLLIFDAGVVGVSFFFVLSGFILTYNYIDWFREGVAGATYARFVWDRLTRIYPVHLLTMLMALPIQMFSPRLPLDWRAVPFHLLLMQCWWPVSRVTFYNFLNVPSWSISCEWFFYLVAPMVISLAFGRKRFWVLVGVMVIYACGLGLVLSQTDSAYARLYFVSWFAPSRLPEFLMGVCVARFFMGGRMERVAPKAMLVQGAGIVLLIGGAMYRAVAPWPLHGGLLYVPGSALLVLGLACGRGVFAVHLGRPWLKRLGMASFALYMLQAPILRATKGVCLHFGWEVGSWAMFSAVTLGMFGLTQTAAFVVHSKYERPLQGWLRRLRSPYAEEASRGVRGDLLRPVPRVRNVSS